jgi:predicted outer membrane protein
MAKPLNKMKIKLKQNLITLGVTMLASAAMAQGQYNNNNGQGMPNNNNGQGMPGADGASQPMSAQHFVWEAAMIDRQEIHASELALEKSDNADVKHFAKKMIADHKTACKKLQAIAENEGLKYPDTNSMGMNNGGRWDDNWSTNEDGTNFTSTDIPRGQDYTTNVTATDTGAGTNMLTARGQGTMPIQPVDTTPNSDSTTNAFTTTTPPRGQGAVSNMDSDVSNGVGNNMNHHTWNQGNPAMNLEMLSGTAFDQAYASKMVMGHQRAIRKYEMASTDLQDGALKNYADKMLPDLRTHLEKAQALQAKVGSSSDNNMGSPNTN